MAIYSKKIIAHDGWFNAFNSYECISGFEPMYQDEVEDGGMTFKQAWVANIAWLEDVLAETTNISIPIED